jgi:acyl transferase domain-containing protein
VTEPGGTTGTEIAIIGMAGRFPGAPTLDAFWNNLARGVESIQTFSDDQLRAAGIDAATLQDPDYVRAGAVIEGVEMFDAAFFGYSHREAEMMDPQQRIFLECAWEALETAGYAPERYRGAIGVYAGTSMNLYWLFMLYSNPERVRSVGAFQTMTGNDRDYLTTRVSYKLNLRGPSMNVQTACSTAMVAVHQACQSLISGECDMALAGGVSIKLPVPCGYQYHRGGILSPDGHCRAFDARGQGTLYGSGAGIVVLKRLVDALADGDHVEAVIKGSAIQ